MSCDLLILNGTVLTQDDKRPRVEAIAVSQGRIVKLGRSRDIAALKGRKTRVIDAEGATVLPGFTDAHVHIFGGSMALGLLDVDGVSGYAALEKAVRAYDKSHPGQGLILGNQLNYVVLGENQPMTRDVLDRILPDRPLLLYAPDYHTAWANTLALKMAGLFEGLILPPGHEVVMGSDGKASGELHEPLAIAPVADLAPENRRPRLGIDTGGDPEKHVSEQEYAYDLDLLRRGLAHLAAHGITSFHNMDGNLYTMQLLASLEAQGQLTARGIIPFHFKPYMPVAALERARVMHQAYKGRYLRSGAVKMFMDGVVDSGTAVMLDDYPDHPGWRGDPLFSQAKFNAVAVAADALGLQIAVHAIGDGAVRMVLDGYAAARKQNGKRDSRHRVEHIEVIHPDDIKRFKKLGVLASVQTPHAPGGQGLPLQPTLRKIGKAKWPYAYAWQTLRKAGATMVFGTDWPVSDVNPLRAIHTAVTREPWEAGLPNQRQSLSDALASYTASGAYAGFAETYLGKLRTGYAADIVVLDRNIERVAVAEIAVTRPRFTISGGRVVYEA